MTAVRQQQMADDLQEIKAALPNFKRVLNFQEACQYLGYCASYLYKLTSAGKIPFSKPTGKKLFFDRVKLDEFLLSNGSLSEKEKEARASTYISKSK